MTLLATPISELRFQFLDPVEVLMRLLLTGPLSADNSNLQFGPRDRNYYEDFCDGERLRRIYAYSLPKKGTALTCILFFDKINSFDSRRVHNQKKAITNFEIH